MLEINHTHRTPQPDAVHPVCNCVAPRWRRPSTSSPLWMELSFVARRDGLILQRALNPSAETRRGRYFLRDPRSGSVVFGASTLRALQVWMRQTQAPSDSQSTK